MPNSKDRGDDGAERRHQVEALVRRLEPEIIAIFRRGSIAPDDAGGILEEVVTLLLYRWENVTRPETWLLEMLNRRSDAIKERAGSEAASENGPPRTVGR